MIERSGSTVFAVDVGAYWALTDSTRLGWGSHAVRDSYSSVDAGDNEIGITTNHWLVGVSGRQSFGDDAQVFFGRADVGLVVTIVNARRTVDNVEIEIATESGFGFLTRAGYGFTASETLNIAPQLTFAGFSLPSGFNSSLEFGVSFTF